MKIIGFSWAWFWRPGDWIMSLVRGEGHWFIDFGPLSLEWWKRKNA